MALIDSLNQILEWHGRNGTPTARLIKPGLSEEEIVGKLEGLPFKMTREFVELYKWHDGVPSEGIAAAQSFLEFHRFLPLEEALNNFQASYPIILEFYNLTDWVQVFMDPAGDGYGLGGGPEFAEHAPVVFLFEGEGVQIVFESLEKMMETAAAAFEGGVMSWLEGQLETDYFAWGEVAHRLNPGIRYWEDYVRGSG